jgi:hypothetical protein
MAGRWSTLVIGWWDWPADRAKSNSCASAGGWSAVYGAQAFAYDELSGWSA